MTWNKTGEKNCTVAVKFENGHWVTAGDNLVNFKEGSIATLKFDEACVKNKEQLEPLLAKKNEQFFVEGDELRVILSIKDEDNISTELLNNLISVANNDVDLSNKYSNSFFPINVRLVSIKIGPATDLQKMMFDTKVGGAWLNLQGGLAKSISTSIIYLPPGLNVKEASSLNHALTLLSEAYEPWRMSHTGNVYDRVFYKNNKDGIWYPINKIRRGCS